MRGLDLLKFTDEDILDIAINAGAKDCKSTVSFHEIVCEKEEFYKVKSEIEKKVGSFIYSGVEWRSHNYINLNKEQNEKVIQVLEALDEDDDVQDTFINCNLEMI